LALFILGDLGALAVKRLFSKLKTPTALLYIFLMFTQIVTGIYVASGLEPPALFTAVVFLGFLWITGWWLRTDSRKREFRWVYDMGLFLYVAWPIVLPYYLLKTRGARGLLVILGFVAAYIAAAVLGMMLYLFLTPEGWPTAF
jgi:hypothetical protein